MNFHRLATQSTRAAARLRAELEIGPADAVCPFDLTERLGVVTWLASVPSLEGMYSPEGAPTIIVGAERPPGRRRHTCAHELGHHVFGHGLRLDQMAEEADIGSGQPEEYVADRFAVALLMPKLAVESALTRRGWSASTLTAKQAFRVSQDLGVSYSNFIRHLDHTLGVLDGGQVGELRRAGRRLPRLRASLAGFPVANDLIVADRHWGARLIDVEVGDVVLIPDGGVPMGDCVCFVREPIPHLRAVAAGEGSVTLGEGRVIKGIRVSLRNFTGLARYRHLEDPDDVS